MEKYYKSYYLIDDNLISLDEFNRTTYNFKVYFSPSAGCVLAEGYDQKKEVYWVLYFAKEMSDHIFDFHMDTFGLEVKKSLCNQLKNGVELIFFNDRIVSKYSIENYHDDGRLKLLQIFNQNFELVEYRKSIYDESGNLIQEKIFFADSWTIHVEKMP